MSVTVKLPPVLRQDAGGARTVDLDAPGDLRGALSALVEQFPGLRTKLLDDAGDLNRFVNAYVDGEDVRLREGLDTSLADGSTVIVLPAMAGGAR
jgi:molybdopterin converting factor small subunit